VVRVGVNGNLPTFSEVNASGEYVGFEPTLARELMRRLFGDLVTIEWVEVSARQRPTALADGTIDIFIRNTGFAPERSTWGEWTDQFYFVDGQRVLVRVDSGIIDNATLQGRAVAVQSGTNAETTINATLAPNGVTVIAQQGTLIELASDLETGFVDGLSADWTSLEAIRQSLENPDDFVVVGDLLTSVPWNIATAPGEIGLRDDIAFALNQIIDDGTWEAIYNLTFGQPLPPVMAEAFATGELATIAPAAAVVAEEVAPPVSTAEAAPQESAPAPTQVIESDLPITGDVNVTIFTAETQQRTLRITPQADGTFVVELIRLGEVVYDGRFDFYESSGRYENIRNSFEFIEFSDTAGDSSLGCDRQPDMTGQINGAAFEVKVGC
jgi:ABC-type amino acid transport substrate-binding protein